MAASTDLLLKEVKDMTECPICSDKFCNPKMLHCSHTFCLKCIEHYGADKRPGDALSCPMCRREFKVPTGGLSKLNTNFVIERLIAAQSGSGAKSDVCTEDPLEKYLDEPQLVATIHVGKSVWGLAQLENKIFVISIESTKLLVYNAHTYEPIKGYGVNDLSYPRDLASDLINKCLYIVETGRNQLRSIDADGRFLMSRVLPSEAYNISVTETGTIVLLFADGVKEFNNAGLILREISFSDLIDSDLKITDWGDRANINKTVTNVRQSSCMEMTWQALSLGSDGYIACQGWASSENHRVYIADREWRITQSYGHRGHSAGQLCDPVYLAKDRDGCVLVADSGNNRVVLLTTDKLVHIRDLLSKKDGVELPYRLLLDDANGLLYVGLGVNVNAKVLVFQLFKSK